MLCVYYDGRTDLCVCHLQHVVQRQVPEALPGNGERACGLLHLMGLVPWCLGILHLGHLHVLTHPVKLLLSLLEPAHIPEHQRGLAGVSHISDSISG